MLASFIIGFHTARIDNLLQTLRFLLRDHRPVFTDSYLSLVCQDNCDTLPAEKLNELESLREQSHRSCLINLSYDEMRLPELTNMGVEDAETDKLIILESDRILPAGYFAAVIEQLEEGVQITTKNMVKLRGPATDDEIVSRLFQFDCEARNPRNELGQRNMWSGNTAIMKRDYYKAGQMDEAYTGYGWADSDMTKATESVGLQSIYRDEVELHLWHHPATYGKSDQKQLFINNGLHFCKKWGVDLPMWFREEIAQHKRVLI